MKVGKDIILRKVGKTYIAVPVGEACRRFKGVIKLNESAKFIWESISANLTEEETIAAMVERYEITEERAATAYKKTLIKLEEIDVLAD